MVNGLRVDISESDFKSMPLSDQNWKLYLGVTKIDQQGCSWALKNYKGDYWRKLIVFGTSAGTGLGFAYMIGKAINYW